MEDSSAFLGTKLLVIGDSHAKFWKGHDNLLGEDLLPGVRTREIPGGLAYTLTKEHSTVGARQISLHTIREAIAQGFDGWLLLSFGEIDMRAHAMYHAMYHAISIGVVESVRSIVTQYIAFIHEVRTLHSKVAVLGADRFTSPRSELRRPLPDRRHRNRAQSRDDALYRYAQART